MSRPKGRWKLTVRDEFAAAHALRHYQGKCEALHGHNFGVEACVIGKNLLPDVEMLADFKNIKAALKKTLALLDHHDLNAIGPFDLLNPTSENLAFFIFQQMKKELADDPACTGVTLFSVTVSERAIQSATYMEEDA